MAAAAGHLRGKRTVVGSLIAVIGGTGLNTMPGFQIASQQQVETRWGLPSAPLQRGSLDGVELVFLARHGAGHTTAPHAINYRANIQALKDVGVSAVIAINAVGGIRDDYPPASVGVPDQLIDYTSGREHSFCGAGEPLQHIDFTEPFDPGLRSQLLAAAEAAAVGVVVDGTVAVTNGPRLETAAEIRKYQRDGCDLVGMTSMPEAALAKEAGLVYASIAVSVNYAAGMGSGDIHAEIEQSVADGMAKVQKILSKLVAASA